MTLTWAGRAIAAIDAEERPTPLRDLGLADPDIRLLVKDESAQPTGSIKDRAARSLFRYAVASGWITEGSTVVEATGGAAAVAQAHVAHRIGVRYIAVMPGAPDPRRAEAVEKLGGEVRFVNPPLAIYDAARELATELGGHFLDMYGASDRAIDWRGKGIGDELLSGDRPADDPQWIVVGAGTGATSAAIGRAIRRLGRGTRLAVVDPENSAYFPGWASGARDYGTGMPSRIPGIGRPRMEPGFRPELIDLVIPVPDGASVAAARFLRERFGHPVGASTGTALWGGLLMVERLRAARGTGKVVFVRGDASESVPTGVDPDAHAAELARMLEPRRPG